MPHRFSALSAVALSAALTTPALAGEPLASSAEPLMSLAPSQSEVAPPKETNCEDRRDDDGDSLVDCLDSDCYELEVCKTAGGMENTDLLCTDGIDNDGDGALDCEDKDCYRAGVSACGGSWKGPLSGTGVDGGGSGDPSEMPPLPEGATVEDLIGTGSDIDGERNDYLCSDGFDNDGDGLVDCQDYGCRFDPQVSVCQAQLGGVRFSVWAHAQISRNFDRDDDELQWDAGFNRMQLRAFGEFPFIQNSFFLLSIRADRTPRLTFATFQLPLGGGHFFVINAGSGALSNKLVLGTQKNLLLDRPFYLFTPFESGNGVTIEQNGPIIQGLLEYRYFIAGGAGNFNGNIGGRFFENDDFNFTWGAGGQIAWFPVGRFDRWDSRFLYTPAPLGWSVYVGGRYDEKELERFPAGNISTLFRWNRFLFTAEGWIKRELNFGAWQFSWNATAGFLIVPKLLMFGADIGQFFPGDYDTRPDDEILASRDFRRQTDQLQYRAALHAFVWRNNGVLSLLYTHSEQERFDDGAFSVPNDGFYENQVEREIRLEARLGF